jgi:hypothetical protein
MNSDPRKPPAQHPPCPSEVDQFLLIGFAYFLLYEVYLRLSRAHLTW